MDNVPLNPNPLLVSPQIGRLELFAIGLSAGACAVGMPRLGSVLMASRQESINISLSSGEIFGMIVATLLIAVATYWLNVGTNKSQRDIFISALAIPSLLSGTIQMGDLTNASANMAKYQEKTIQHLTKELASRSNIKIDDGGIKQENINSIQDFGIISSAYGEEKGIAKSAEKGTTIGTIPPAPSPLASSGTTFNLTSTASVKNYLVVLEKSADQHKLNDILMQLQGKGIDALKVKSLSDGQYALTSGMPATKSQAVLSATKIQDQLEQTKKNFGISVVRIE